MAFLIFILYIYITKKFQDIVIKLETFEEKLLLFNYLEHKIDFSINQKNKET